MKRNILSALVIGMSVVTCPAFSGTTSSAGIPNPASIFCIEQGGQEVTVVSPQGESGLCTIDRGEIGSWTFFNSAQYQRENTAVTTFLEHPAVDTPSCPEGIHCSDRPTPAKYYCEALGGTHKTLQDRQGYFHELCQFKDNSVIGAWTLFAGPEAHPALAAKLMGAFDY